MKFFMVLFIFEGLVYAELSNSDTMNIKDIAKNIPSSLTNLTKVPTSVDEIPQEAVEEVQMKMEEKCRKVGGEAAFSRAKHAKDELMTCIQNLINMTELQQKVEEAKPHGKLDEVTREYCQKSPVLKDCIKNFTDAAEGCLEQKEKESVRTTLNITNAILDFVCYKQGDRIALFIAEGGQDCLNKTQNEIQQCMNSTIGKLVPRDKNNIETVPSMVLGEKECLSVKDMQTCTVDVMEKKCSEPTPANIIESMFKFIVKMTPCSEYISYEENGGGGAVAATLGATVFSVFVAAIVSL